jgi:hypothetical protein
MGTQGREGRVGTTKEATGLSSGRAGYWSMQMSIRISSDQLISLGSGRNRRLERIRGAQAACEDCWSIYNPSKSSDD